MPNPLQKSLHGYLSKIKRETGKLHLSNKWVLPGSNHPKKLSFSFHHRRRTTNTRFKPPPDHDDSPSPHAATLSDIDRFLEENFKSLCIRDEEGDHHRMNKDKEKKDCSSDEDDSDDEDDPYRHRFERTWGPAVYDSPKLQTTERLSPPPGSSSDGRPSMDTSTSTTEERQSRSRSSPSPLVLPENCIAVLRYTADPQEDFRRSMLEMLDSKPGMQECEVDWDLMEKLLFCYLDLNNKQSHRFILGAFVDLIISLRDKEKRITRKGLPRSISTRVARDRLRKRMTIRN